MLHTPLTNVPNLNKFSRVFLNKQRLACEPCIPAPSLHRVTSQGSCNASATDVNRFVLPPQDCLRVLNVDLRGFTWSLTVSGTCDRFEKTSSTRPQDCIIRWIDSTDALERPTSFATVWLRWLPLGKYDAEAFVHTVHCNADQGPFPERSQVVRADHPSSCSFARSASIPRVHEYSYLLYRQNGSI